MVNQVEETAEVAGGEVVSDALENVEDLVVGDLAVVVFIGLFVECSEDLVNGHHFLVLRGVAFSTAFSTRWLFLLQKSGEKHASVDCSWVSV